MAVSDFVDPVYLNTWQHVMEADGGGGPIWWFNQAKGTDAQLYSGAKVWVQFERDIVAQGLAEAVQGMETYLHSPLIPTYVTERIEVDESTYATQSQYLQAKYGNIVAFGTRATTLLDADASIVYSSAYSPTIDDTATITLTDSDTDPDEIQVFIRVADGAPTAGDTRYRIFPLTVVRTNATTITITGHRALFVKPSVWNLQYTNIASQTRNFANTADASDFLTAVDIYRVYTDTTTDNAQATVYGEPYSLSSSDPVTTSATVRLVDGKPGTFQVRYSSTQLARTDAVEVNYLAGFALVNQRMNPAVSRPMTRYANTLFPEQLAPIFDITFGRYGEDRETPQSGELMAGDVRNPFGLTKGAVYAWRRVRALSLGTRARAV